MVTTKSTGPILAAQLNVTRRLYFYAASSLCSFLLTDFDTNYFCAYHASWLELEQPLELLENIFVDAYITHWTLGDTEQ